MIRDSISDFYNVTRQEGAVAAPSKSNTRNNKAMRVEMLSRFLVVDSIKHPHPLPLPDSISRASMSLGCLPRALSFSREARLIFTNRSSRKGVATRLDLIRPSLMRQRTCSQLISNNSRTSNQHLKKRRSLGQRRLIHRPKRPLLYPRPLRSWVISRSIPSTKKSMTRRAATLPTRSRAVAP